MGVVAIYSHKVVGSLTGACWRSALLAALYGYLYVLLEQEAYSLVWGSVGLFLRSTVFMYVTRNIDWYSQERKVAAGSGDAAASSPRPA